MLFSRKELTRWLGMSIFEIWLSVVCFLVFSIFLAMKLEGDITWSWWSVFIPLFAFDGCAGYFAAIVCIRMVLENEKRKAALRTLWNGSNLALLFVYKVLLCQRLELENLMTYSVIHTPVFIFLLMLTIRGCHIGS
jgi:hypothetical protein